MRTHQLAGLRLALKRAAARIACLRGIRPGEGARCLMYHSVTRDELRDPRQMQTPLALFEQHLRILREDGYLVRDASWLAEVLRSRTQIPPRTVVISFDDGLADLLDAAQALERSGHRATAFVIGAALTGDLQHLPRIWPGGYLTVEQVKGLRTAGTIDVGVHGLTHRALAGLEARALRDETVGARETVSEQVGADVTLYAYPRGGPLSWDRTAERAVATAGYRGAFTSVAGAVRLGTDPYAIARARVSWADDPSSFRMLLRGCYDWYAVVQELQARIALLTRRN